MGSTLVGADTLARHLDDPSRIVIDCRFSLADPARGERDFARSRIPGARYAHLDRDLSGPIVPGRSGRHPLPRPEALRERLRALGVGRASTVVAYDDGPGTIAARLWWLLRSLGHSAALVLDGGFATWREKGLPLEEGPPGEIVAGDLEIGDPLVASVDTDTVAAGGLRLLDARERERFRGEREPIDPIAGRIPGARNHPCADNLDAEGRFLPPEILRERFARALGPTGEGALPLVHYCGSGVTAAHNVLAMTHAGLEPGALYGGSFSEWITRHDVETGDGA